MRRVALFVVLVVFAAGCHFPQGWHLPRVASNGSSTTQTLVCWQNDVVTYQGPYVAYGASLLNAHPEIAVTMRDTCPTNMNRVIWRTGQTGYAALTGFGCCLAGTKHSNFSTVTLDPGVGRLGTIEQSKAIIRHEICHTQGGGGTDWMSDNPAHRMCNDWAHTSAEISRLSHDDPG